MAIIGFLPFDAEFPDEVIRNTLEGEYNFNDEVWSRISEEAKDLI
jgi:hypothetical protein